MRKIIVILMLVLVVGAAQAETLVEWYGKNSKGDHLLHVTKNNKVYTFAVPERDLDDEKALNEMMDFVVEVIRKDNANN